MIAILAQNGNVIGLFEHLRIHQDIREIHLFRYTRNLFANRPMPVARLAEEVYSTGPVSNTITALTSPNIVLNQDGMIQENSTTTCSLIRIPYVASYLELMDIYPVYTLNPDHFLPWNRTMTTSMHTIPRRVINQRHFRLQNTLVPRTNIPRVLAADARCPITLESLTSDIAYWLPCSHVFSDAILQAVDLDPRCPLCRCTVSIEDIQTAS